MKLGVTAESRLLQNDPPLPSPPQTRDKNIKSRLNNSHQGLEVYPKSGEETSKKELQDPTGSSKKEGRHEGHVQAGDGDIWFL